MEFFTSSEVRVRPCSLLEYLREELGFSLLLIVSYFWWLILLLSVVIPAHARLRECLVLSYVPQHFECLIEGYEKWNGCDIRIRQKGIFEIDLKKRGVRISAFDVRFPKCRCSFNSLRGVSVLRVLRLMLSGSDGSTKIESWTVLNMTTIMNSGR